MGLNPSSTTGLSSISVVVLNPTLQFLRTQARLFSLHALLSILITVSFTSYRNLGLSDQTCSQNFTQDPTA